MVQFPTHIVAAGAFVTNENGQVLLVKDERRGWTFPGGQIEIGESIPQGVIREVEEETGVKCEVENIIGIYSNTTPRKGYNGVEHIPTMVNVDFICKYKSGDLRTSDETLEVGWFDIEKAKNMITHFKYVYRFENMINSRNKFHCYAFKEPFEFIEKYEFDK